MSAAPRDDRINARAQLEHVARGLYADPTEALRAMRHDAHAQGAEEVRRRLENNFTHYGVPATRIHGPARTQAQEILRSGGVAADVERWLTLDHQPPPARTTREQGMEPGVPAPAAQPSREEAAEPSPGGGNARGHFDAEERLAYDRLVDFADARARAERRQIAEMELHGIQDHRANLAAAEETLPLARDALREEVAGAFRDGEKALMQIEAAMERDGPAETARRLRAGDLLRGEEKPIRAQRRHFGIFPWRDREAEAGARGRVADRIRAVGYREEALETWSTYAPPGGAPVSGASNVRAALEKEEAKLRAEHGIGAARRDGEARPNPHPSREASQRSVEAQRALDRLPPESRERVIRAARQSGGDRIASALGHLQTIQMAARTIREGIEPPGH